MPPKQRRGGEQQRSDEGYAAPQRHSQATEWRPTLAASSSQRRWSETAASYQGYEAEQWEAPHSRRQPKVWQPKPAAPPQLKAPDSEERPPLRQRKKSLPSPEESWDAPEEPSLPEVPRGPPPLPPPAAHSPPAAPRLEPRRRHRTPQVELEANHTAGTSSSSAAVLRDADLPTQLTHCRERIRALENQCEAHRAAKVRAQEQLALKTQQVLDLQARFDELQQRFTNATLEEEQRRVDEAAEDAGSVTPRPGRAAAAPPAASATAVALQLEAPPVPAHIQEMEAMAKAAALECLKGAVENLCIIQLESSYMLVVLCKDEAQNPFQYAVNSAYDVLGTDDWVEVEEAQEGDFIDAVTSLLEARGRPWAGWDVFVVSVTSGPFAGIRGLGVGCKKPRPKRAAYAALAISAHLYSPS